MELEREDNMRTMGRREMKEEKEEYVGNVKMRGAELEMEEARRSEGTKEEEVEEENGVRAESGERGGEVGTGNSEKETDEDRAEAE